MMEDAIADNTTRIQDQRAFQHRFAQLETQHQDAVEKLAATEAESATDGQTTVVFKDGTEIAVEG